MNLEEQTVADLINEAVESVNTIKIEKKEDYSSLL